MQVCDNQQETTIGWFVGILEGEGNFQEKRVRTNVHNYKHSDKHYTGTTCEFLRITNTNADIIKACERFLDKNHMLYETYGDTKRTSTGKKIMRIMVSGGECRNLYNLIESELQCRRDEYQRIIGSSETLRDITVSLDWLVGIWQAEGSFCISEYEGKMTPQLNVTNTNEKIIERIVMTLYRSDLAWHVSHRVPLYKKAFTTITISGMKRCQRFLRKTRGLWIGKRDIARSSLMLEFIDSRFTKVPQQGYDDHELEIVNRMRQLNS